MKSSDVENGVVSCNLLKTFNSKDSILSLKPSEYIGMVTVLINSLSAKPIFCILNSLKSPAAVVL